MMSKGGCIGLERDSFEAIAKYSQFGVWEAIKYVLQILRIV